MKSSGVILIATVGVTLLASIATVKLSENFSNNINNGINLQVNLNKVPAVNTDIITRMEQVQSSLQSLNSQGSKTQHQLNLKKLGFSQKEISAHYNKGKTRSKHPKENHFVALTFITANEKWAIINGHRYKIGEVLKGHTERVIKIERKRVQLSRSGKNYWIPVNNPILNQVISDISPNKPPVHTEEQKVLQQLKRLESLSKIIKGRSN
jgi:type II secretory pathway component PulC